MKKYIFASALFFAAFCLASCDSFLDREPQSSITPEAFFTSEGDLSSYTINLYPDVFTTVKPGAYGISIYGNDNNTDNQAATTCSSRWVPGQWLVPSSDPDVWNFSTIRHCNYFLENVLPKQEAGEINGSSVNIDHYIGEAYFLRAAAYFSKLQSIGDCPIVTTTLPDDEEVLIAASKRSPRHEVARFILADLDRAIALLGESSPAGKNRITRDAAYLFRSRVALFEGTWLKHHEGTAFVPGGNGWPGNTADLLNFNIDSEIQFFLTEAKKSAKEIGDRYVGSLAVNTDTREGMDANFVSINPYYTMFCDASLDAYDEVIMWRQYSQDKGVTHNIQMQLMNNGGGTGWTRGLVNSFLMRNGLPIYADASGYDPEWEKQGVEKTLQNRDSRIWIFTKKDGDIDDYNDDGTANYFDLRWLVKGNYETRMVTGFAMKKFKHYDGSMQTQHNKGVTASIVFRASEALLNYMEANYELDGTIDATSDQYWRALRERAKVDPDYNKTIAATDMQQEALSDFGAYSHGELIDPTLYNIRRERRNELIGESFRWGDLCRWRACDQVDGYQIEGIRYWGSVYEGTLTADDGTDLAIVDVEGGAGNISSLEVSGVYVRPFQISYVNNSSFDGLHFTPAHYLSPLPQSVFRQTSAGDKTDFSTSSVYQNPGWGMVAGNAPADVE